MPTMARFVDPEDLVGAAEIARRLGASKGGVVSDWRRRHPDFPAPIRELAMGPVWLWSEVQAWAIATGRLSMPTARRKSQ